MAQNVIGLPELKIEPGGTVDAPVLINNSANNIIGYVLRVESDTGITALPVFKLGSLARNPLESAGIVQRGKDVFTRGVQAGVQAGCEVLCKRSQRRQPGNNPKVSVDSVVFSDGKFAGPDTVMACPSKSELKLRLKKLAPPRRRKTKLLKSYTASSSPSASRRPGRRHTALVKSPIVQSS